MVNTTAALYVAGELSINWLVGRHYGNVYLPLRGSGISAVTFIKFQFVFVIALTTLVVGAETPSLPTPEQVDRPEMIRFIEPDIKKLAGIVVDDVDAKLIGTWQHSVHTPPFVGASYIHDMKDEKGKKSATFIPDLPKAGRYQVRMSHNSNVRRANVVPVTITHADGQTVVKVNEGEPAPIKKLFRPLGTFRFLQGTVGSVTISTHGTDGKYVIVDAIQFIPVD